MADLAGQPEYRTLLSPEALAKIHRIELLSREMMEGFITGRHRSPYKGSSMEFAEHRPYVPGDDVRTLDWRVYGKSDRYYIKQYEEETNLRATILLDASGSMAYTGERASHQDGQPVSKFAFARYLTAALAHLLLHQQDAVGLVTFDTAVRRYIPARSRADHLRILLEELWNTAPGGETSLAPILHDIAERIHRRSFVVLLSDCFGDAAALLQAVQHFRYRKHEVVVFHILAAEERNFPFRRNSRFRDLESTGGDVRIDPRAFREKYIEAFSAYVEELQAGLGRMQADYVPMLTSEDFDVALAGYLARRRSAGR